LRFCAEVRVTVAQHPAAVESALTQFTSSPHLPKLAQADGEIADRGKGAEVIVASTRRKRSKVP
jgi:hypothetical protein